MSGKAAGIEYLYCSMGTKGNVKRETIKTNGVTEIDVLQNTVIPVES